jgi:D-lactate dehydrogenase (cytochrome)
MSSRAGVEKAIEELRALLGDRLSTSESVRAIHGRDESSFSETPPEAVATPATTEEVASVVRACGSHGVPLIPFGAGTSLEGHVLATRGGISIDLSAMDRILEVSPDDLDCRVQPGVHRMALNEHLGRQGLFFSVDPGADATLGGMASTRASGTTTVRYGSMRDNVLALEVVLASGEAIRTGTRARKSSAGYDLTRLFVGSEGTLGIITELTLRVHGIPERIGAAVCSFPTVRAAVDTAIAIVQLGIPVARCELVDGKAMAAINAYSQMSEPETPTLFLEFHGTDASVAEAAQQAGEIASGNGGSAFRWTADEGDRARLWKARHDYHFASRALRPGCKPVVTDAAVPVSRLAECIDETRADYEGLPFPTLVVGHVADGNFHTSLVIDPERPDEVEAARAAAKRLSARANRMGGTCTGEHGIGIGKREALVDELGPAVDVMRALKAALDPEGILNPGKIFLS